MTPEIPRILTAILPGYALSPWGIHGVVHWARVMENGLKLAEVTKADPRIVALFALFHDSRRLNDGDDPEHGLRGAELALELRGEYFELPDDAFELLYRACECHTIGRSDPNITVLTCWDSDRLDLGRVGIMPSPKYLCTDYGRTSKMIEWANTRALADYEPEFVSHWNLAERTW